MSAYGAADLTEDQVVDLDNLIFDLGFDGATKEITDEMNEAAVTLTAFGALKEALGSQEERDARDRVVARSQETVARCAARIDVVREWVRKGYQVRLKAHLKRYPRGQRRFRG